MSNSEKLIKTIEEKLNKWNERNTFTIKGISNLSRSDLDTILLYVNAYKRSGEKDFGDLMEPKGYVGDVLEKFQIIKSKSIIY